MVTPARRRYAGPWQPAQLVSNRAVPAAGSSFHCQITPAGGCAARPNWLVNQSSSSERRLHASLAGRTLRMRNTRASPGNAPSTKIGDGTPPGPSISTPVLIRIVSPGTTRSPTGWAAEYVVKYWVARYANDFGGRPAPTRRAYQAPESGNERLTQRPLMLSPLLWPLKRRTDSSR